MPLSGLLKSFMDSEYVAKRNVALAALAGVSGVYLLDKLSFRLRYNMPPGPISWPIIGNMSLFSKYTFFRTLEDDLRKEYGDLATVQMMGSYVVVVFDYDFMMEAMVKKQYDFADRFQFYSLELFSEGYNAIFASPYNERWKAHRKYSYSAIRQFAQGEQLERSVLNAFSVTCPHFVTDEPVDMYESLYVLTYNNNANLIYSRDYQPDDEELVNLRSWMDELNRTVAGGGVPGDVFSFLKYFPFPSHRKIKKLNYNLQTFFKNLIAERKASRTDGELNDMLDLMIIEQQNALKSGNGHFFEDIHLRQTILDLFSGGTDTATWTLYWFIGFLKEYPDIQEKCYQEVLKSYGETGVVTLDKRSQLPYVDAFIHEAMRLGVIAPVNVRSARCDTTLGGYDIPKGTQVFINAYSPHYDAKNFPNPKKFDPTRFLSSDGKELAPYPKGYMPFGAGVRVCLGEMLAKKFIYLFTVLLIQKYKFVKVQGEPALDFQYKDNYLLGFPERYKVKLIKRFD